MDGHVHPETLEETPPQFLTAWFYSGVEVIEQYGWYMLGGFLLFYYLSHKIEPYIQRWREEREERKFAAMCHKNPDLIRSRQEAMEAMRQRLQAEHDEQARLHAEKMKEREAKKREEMLAKLEGRGGVQLGHRLSNSSDTERTTPQRPDYNPLMGAGGSGGYRPPRRGCPGGGCG